MTAPGGIRQATVNSNRRPSDNLATLKAMRNDIAKLAKTRANAPGHKEILAQRAMALEWAIEQLDDDRQIDGS